MVGRRNSIITPILERSFPDEIKIYLYAVSFVAYVKVILSAGEILSVTSVTKPGS